MQTPRNLYSRLIIQNNNNHLNLMIKYPENNNDENICAYYKNLRHLRK